MSLVHDENGTPAHVRSTRSQHRVVARTQSPRRAERRARVEFTSPRHAGVAKVTAEGRPKWPQDALRSRCSRTEAVESARRCTTAKQNATECVSRQENVASAQAVARVSVRPRCQRGLCTDARARVEGKRPRRRARLTQMRAESRRDEAQSPLRWARSGNAPSRNRLARPQNRRFGRNRRMRARNVDLAVVKIAQRNCVN